MQLAFANGRVSLLIVRIGGVKANFQPGIARDRSNAPFSAIAHRPIYVFDVIAGHATMKLEHDPVVLLVFRHPQRREQTRGPLALHVHGPCGSQERRFGTAGGHGKCGRTDRRQLRCGDARGAGFGRWRQRCGRRRSGPWRRRARALASDERDCKCKTQVRPGRWHARHLTDHGRRMEAAARMLAA
jgi:hypothetical protein